MSGPMRVNASMPIGSHLGVSVSTSAARRPWSVLLPTPSSFTATATRGFGDSSPSPASACSPPPHKTSRKWLSPWRPGPYGPESRRVAFTQRLQNKTPSKIDGVCQRSEPRMCGAFFVIWRSLYLPAPVPLPGPTVEPLGEGLMEVVPDGFTPLLCAAPALPAWLLMPL